MVQNLNILELSCFNVLKLVEQIRVKIKNRVINYQYKFYL